METTNFTERRARVSATDAIGPALSYTIKILFKPFRFVKWLKFGLVGLLVALGSGGGGGNFFNMPPQASDKFSPGRIAPIIEWLNTHLTLIIILVIAAVVVISLIWMVFIYFSSRFTFVYLDGIVKNDLQIKRAYRENKANGWSYFLWRIIFGPTALLAIVLVIGLPALGLALWIKDKGFTAAVIICLILIVLLFIILLIVLGTIGWLTGAFVVPIMYLLKVRVIEGWHILWELIAFNKSRFLFYIVMHFILNMAAGMLLLLPCCALGCFAIAPALLVTGLVVLALKYPLVWIAVVLLGLILMVITSFVWHTIITPLTVFFRTYPLVFLEGFGNEFTSITQPIPNPTGTSNAS